MRRGRFETIRPVQISLSCFPAQSNERQLWALKDKNSWYQEVQCFWVTRTHCWYNRTDCLIFQVSRCWGNARQSVISGQTWPLILRPNMTTIHWLDHPWFTLMHLRVSQFLFPFILHHLRHHFPIHGSIKQSFITAGASCKKCFNGGLYIRRGLRIVRKDWQ